MDFGFGDILNKIEEEFGKRITRWLLMLVGVAVAAGCVGVIWTALVAPLLTFLGSPQRAQTGWSIALVAFGIGAGISLGSSFMKALADWRWMRTTKAKIDVLEAEFDRVEIRTQESLKEAHRLLDESKEMYGGASNIVTNLVKAARVTAGNAELPTDLRAELDAHIERMERQLEQMREKEREYESRRGPL